jgi:TPR repeat protein
MLSVTWNNRFVICGVLKSVAIVVCSAPFGARTFGQLPTKQLIPLGPAEVSKISESSWNKLSKTKTLYRKSCAVLVGISAYPGLPMRNQLQYCEDDLRELKRILVTYYGFKKCDITSLIGPAATAKSIQDQIARFRGNSEFHREDRVIFFFSGHGQYVDLASVGRKGFLIPFGANLDLKHLENPEPYIRDCLDMGETFQHLCECPAQILFIADACYTGYLGSKPFEKPSNFAVSSMPAHFAFTAVNKNEPAGEDKKIKHGYFSYALCQELEQRAHEKVPFSIAELYASVASKVTKRTNQSQHPLLNSRAEDSPQGQMIFVPTPSTESIGFQARDAMDIYYGTARPDIERSQHCFKSFQKLSELNDADGFAGLASCYRIGFGVNRDAELAYKNAVKATELGSPWGMTRLALCYEDSHSAKGYEQAAKWYEKAAERGDVVGMNNLGLLYETGRGVPTDLVKAKDLYQKSAEAGNPDAMVNLGRLYALGEGTQKDPNRAFRWFKDAKDFGALDGFYHYALCLEVGFGTSQDKETAFLELQKAISLTNTEAQDFIPHFADVLTHFGLMYKNGIGVEKSYEQAFQPFKRAADLGSSGAMVELGVAFETGQGIPKNLSKARDYYQKAAEKGNCYGAYDLGLLYEFGKLGEKNLSQAEACYRRSLDLDPKFDRAKQALARVRKTK